jgi:hypothetical protein
MVVVLTVDEAGALADPDADGAGVLLAAAPLLVDATLWPGEVVVADAELAPPPPPPAALDPPEPGFADEDSAGGAEVG